MKTSQKQLSEWKRILIEILNNEIKVSPMHMTGVMMIQQYQRALSTLRKIFGKPNVLKIDDGLTSLKKKKTYYKIARNEYTERKLSELITEGKIPSWVKFKYEKSSEGFMPYQSIPSEKPEGFHSRAHQIAHEIRSQNEEKKDQLTLI